MRRRVTLMLVFGLLVALTVTQAQERRNQGQGNRRNAQQQEEGEEEAPPLPTDQRLLALHRTFITQAERLALEYERDQDIDKAKTVYQEILKLVPQYEPAQVKLEAIRQLEANAARKTFEVKADRPWQDTGVTVIAGKPITIRAAGAWTFTFTAELTAEGITIPEELKEYNLGSLVGYIDTGNPETSQPFVLGPEKAWIPEHSGRLYVQMYDNDPRDNKGSLQMEFIGSFEAR